MPSLGVLSPWSDLLLDDDIQCILVYLGNATLHYLEYVNHCDKQPRIRQHYQDSGHPNLRD